MCQSISGFNGSIHVISNSKKLRNERVSFTSRKVAPQRNGNRKYEQNWHDV